METTRSCQFGLPMTFGLGLEILLLLVSSTPSHLIRLAFSSPGILVRREPGLRNEGVSERQGFSEHGNRNYQTSEDEEECAVQDH